MLAFGIQYLNGFMAAAEPDNQERAEWPPNPGRVFMAMAAAHFQTGADPQERKALLWLESLEKDGHPLAPAIAASDVSPRMVVKHFVPVNDKAGPAKSFLQSVPIARDRHERTFARAWLADDTVFMMWSEADPDESIRKALEGLCRKVTRIGHSISQVQVWLAKEEEIRKPIWLPDEDHAVTYLRIAPRGTLEYLERQFNEKAIEGFSALAVAASDTQDSKARKEAGKLLRKEYPNGPPQLRPGLAIYHGYARQGMERVGSEVQGTVFSPHLTMLRLETEQGPYRQLDLTSVLVLAGRWHEALLSQSNELSREARTILSGHDADGAPLKGPHLAFIPIAFVGHEHADGHLLGMGITIPADLDREVRREVLRAVGRVNSLKLGRLGVWRVGVVTEAWPARNLRPEAWTGYPNGSTHWSTVTPLVFDRHPKTRNKRTYVREVAEMIVKCCTRVGLPAPREVIATPVSAHLGVPPSHAFPRLQRKDSSQRKQTHAILVFNEPICGPLLLGAGRYRGYGLCRPLDG